MKLDEFLQQMEDSEKQRLIKLTFFEKVIDKIDDIIFYIKELPEDIYWWWKLRK